VGAGNGAAAGGEEVREALRARAGEVELRVAADEGAAAGGGRERRRPRAREADEGVEATRRSRIYPWNFSWRGNEWRTKEEDEVCRSVRAHPCACGKATDTSLRAWQEADDALFDPPGDP
jgi:hypothetical protein